MQKLLLLFLFTLLSANISAQDANTDLSSPSAKELKTYLTAQKANQQNAKGSYSSAQNLEDLIYNLQPSVYYYSGALQTYGEKPKVLFTDMPSLNALSNPSILKNNIEIVTIRINNSSELNSRIDLKVFSSFKNLKYIYIISNTPTSEQKINSMIRNYDEKYSIFYTIDKGDSNQ